MNVLCYEYTGYGLSESACRSRSKVQAGEKSMYADIRAAYDMLVKAGVVPDNIILFGRSMGSGPSCELAARVQVGGLVLISAFTSCLRVAMPWLKIDLRALDTFQNLQKCW